MAKLVDSAVSTKSGMADDDSDSITLTTRKADRIHIFVDDGADGDHAGYELQVDKKAPEEVGHDMRWTDPNFGSDGDPETARSWDIVGLPNEVTITLFNRSGGPADHALHAIAVEEA